MNAHRVSLMRVGILLLATISLSFAPHLSVANSETRKDHRHRAVGAKAHGGPGLETQ